MKPGHKKRFPVLLKQEKDKADEMKRSEEKRKRKEEVAAQRNEEEDENNWKRAKDKAQRNEEDEEADRGRKQAEEEDKERLARALRRKEIEAAEASGTNELDPALRANDSGSTSANSQVQVATNAKALPANKEFHYFASHKVSDTCYCYACAHQNESNP